MNSQRTRVWTSFLTVRTSIVVHCNANITVMRHTVELQIVTAKGIINAFITTTGTVLAILTTLVLLFLATVRDQTP